MEKEHLNSVEDIEHYHQTFIDMKEQYQRDVEVFMKVTKHNLNHMHLACILTASRAMQMEAKLVKMQIQYYEDERFQSHGLTSWLNISKMAENVNVDWAMHPKFALLQFMVFFIEFSSKKIPKSDRCQKNHLVNLDKWFLHV